MIVKDEAETICATLGSVQGIADNIVIIDTGSTDDTKVKALSMSTHDCPVVIRDTIFVDFASARNRALDIAALFMSNSAVFILMLSGGETLHDGNMLRTHLDRYRHSGPNAFHLKVMYGDRLTFYYPHVLRIGGGWRYEGVVHEIPVPTVDPSEEAMIAPGYVWHIPELAEKRAQTLRERNLPLLLEALAISKNDAVYARYLLHLAQTYEEMADLAPQNEPGGEFVSLMTSAIGYYLRRIEMAGYPDEVNYAWMKYLNCAKALRLFSDEEMLLRLSQTDQKRPEIAYMTAALQSGEEGMVAARHAVQVARESRETVITLTPVDASCEWRSHFLAAEYAFKLGKFEEAKQHAAEGQALKEQIEERQMSLDHSGSMKDTHD